jgi:hypothetical protein
MAQAGGRKARARRGQLFLTLRRFDMMAGPNALSRVAGHFSDGRVESPSAAAGHLYAT